MLVFFKQRLVILAMPKTGSTALEAALGPQADLTVTGPPALKHAPVYRYNRFFRPMYDKVCGVELDLVAVMREPVSWLGSWYRYRRRPQMQGHPDSTQDISFDAFVDAYCQGKRPGFADVCSQEKFLEPQPNGCRVHHLFAYENRAALLEFLQKRLGPLPDIPTLNVSPEMELRLSPEVEAKFRHKHARTFELYESIRSPSA